MRTLVAAALLACAKADETSLMQDVVKRSASSQLSAIDDTQSTTGKHSASTSRLLDTAVKMIKSGVTPDVVSFVDSTNTEINENVLTAILSAHSTAQNWIDELCARFDAAIQDLEGGVESVAVASERWGEASEAHQTCRAEEALACATSRRCEYQLNQKWINVKREEILMREWHDRIHHSWCIEPTPLPAIPELLSHPFNWAAMRDDTFDHNGNPITYNNNVDDVGYPILNLPDPVKAFREESGGVTHNGILIEEGYFQGYMAQKIIVEHAWELYNEKLMECSGLEAALDDKTPLCDDAQRALREHGCSHASQSREVRRNFGQEWQHAVDTYETDRAREEQDEADRKAEWETLKIVQCLLDHVHSSVETSIATGAPCPTIDSDPDGVTLAIEDCHIVTRGCGEESLTGHLCLNWCDVPVPPTLPPVIEPACTPSYVAKEQGSFMASIASSYSTELHAADAVYPDDHLEDYFTVLSASNWAGCAAPLVCEDCMGGATLHGVSTNVALAHVCHLDEQYLAPGQSNSDTFRCNDGNCISMAGRCNGHNQCGDDSDEAHCDDNFNHRDGDAYVASSSTCPLDFNTDVHFRCEDGTCIEKVGLCNGVGNCGDGSDEEHCSGAIQVSVESTSGRSITVETLHSQTAVFHDRDYNFDSLGSFNGKTFIKYSNDDKLTDIHHVMTKIRTVEPLTVYIVKLASHGLGWLDSMDFVQQSGHTGLSFSGERATRHKDWNPELMATDNFDASAVFSKTFQAGTISIPGNGGGDGSFLIFLERPVAAPTYVRLAYGAAGCEAGKVITTQQECNEAHEALGLEILEEWTGSNGSIPDNCSTRETNTGSQTSHLHFNINTGAGVGREDLAPVCKA